jgi:hypothetical protein
MCASSSAAMTKPTPSLGRGHCLRARSVPSRATRRNLGPRWAPGRAGSRARTAPAERRFHTAEAGAQLMEPGVVPQRGEIVVGAELVQVAPAGSTARVSQPKARSTSPARAHEHAVLYMTHGRRSGESAGRSCSPIIAASRKSPRTCARYCASRNASTLRAVRRQCGEEPRLPRPRGASALRPEIAWRAGRGVGRP